MDNRTGGPHTGRTRAEGVFHQLSAWVAEQLIVPEQSDEFRTEFDLERLLPVLRREGGALVSFYTAKAESEEGNHEWMLTTEFLDDPSGLQRECLISYALDVTPLVNRCRQDWLRGDMGRTTDASQYEPHTGLLNCTEGEKQIAQHLMRRSSGGAGTLLMLDIDHFRQTNERYGHRTGDAILKYVGSSMRAVFRFDDVLCRWGGDQFAIFLRGVTRPAVVESLVHRIRARLLRCEAGGTCYPLVISVGAAVAEPGDSPEILFEQATRALSCVKLRGGAGFSFFDR